MRIPVKKVEKKEKAKRLLKDARRLEAEAERALRSLRHNNVCFRCRRTFHKPELQAVPGGNRRCPRCGKNDQTRRLGYNQAPKGDASEKAWRAFAKRVGFDWKDLKSQ